MLLPSPAKVTAGGWCCSFQEILGSAALSWCGFGDLALHECCAQVAVCPSRFPFVLLASS